ncbi:Glutathione S-transferase F11-like protein [Drosera capensis]
MSSVIRCQHPITCWPQPSPHAIFPCRSSPPSLVTYRQSPQSVASRHHSPSLRQLNLACLVELGEEFQVIHVDLDSFDHKSPEFLARQPFGQVPAIEDGDFQLYKSRAIIRYLAAKNPLTSGWRSRPIASTIWPTILPSTPLSSRDWPCQATRPWWDSSKEKLAVMLDVYEKRLSKSRYLAGDSFTLADLSRLPAIRYLTNEAGMGELITSREKGECMVG